MNTPNVMNMKSKIFRLIILAVIAVVVVGCAKDVAEPPATDRPIPPTSDIKLPPGKTIPIKRKKPLPLNPSPRPLSADYPTDEYYEEEFVAEDIELLEE